jgi:hypothetical protein
MGCGFNKYTFNDDSISFQFKSNREYEVTKFFNTTPHQQKNGKKKK